MKNSIAIMQPYFLPYLGYWQLISLVDNCVILDDLQYVKQTWINRNRFINKEQAINYFSISLNKGSHFDLIKKKIISDVWISERKKYLTSIYESYKDSINFNEGFSLINKIFNRNSNSLSDFLYESINDVKNYLDIDTNLIKSSSLENEKLENKQDYLIKICKQFNAKNYINSENGQKLYSKKYFYNNGINLYFLKKKNIRYNQNTNNFVDNLYIVDLLMHNKKKDLIKLLDEFSII